MVLQSNVNDFILVTTKNVFPLFVFCCSAQSKSENASKTGTRALGNQVIRKGHMCIQNLGIMKGTHFNDET